MAKQLFNFFVLFFYALLATHLGAANGFNIDGPFRVKTGGGGSCSVQQRSWLREAFNDAEKMITSSITAINKVIDGGDNWIDGTDEYRISTTLQALFNIKTSSANGGPMKDGDFSNLRQIRTTYQNMLDMSKLTNKAVALFCGGDWLKAKIPPDPNARPSNVPQWEAPNDFPHMVWLTEGKPCDGEAAFTIESEERDFMESITICPMIWDKLAKTTLLVTLTKWRDNQNQIADHTYIQRFNSLAQILIHELSHYVSATVDHAYTWPRCAFVATQDKKDALQNADSYGLFAAAMYLDTVNWGTRFGYKKGQKPKLAEAADRRTKQAVLAPEPTAPPQLHAASIIQTGGHIDPFVTLDTSLADQVASSLSKKFQSEVEPPKKTATKVNMAQPTNELVDL